MRFNIQNLVSTLQQQFTRLIGGLLILTLVWQCAIPGVDAAIASPLLATSVDSMSKQVTGKAEEMKGAATRSIGNTQSTIEDKAGAAKMKVNDNVNDAKIAVDGAASRVENAAEQATKRVKNFFGK